MDETPAHAPLPSFAPVERARTEDDQRLADQFLAVLADHGVTVPEFVQQKVEESATAWRIRQVELLGAAYLAVSLHTSHLHSKVGDLARCAQIHPHGNTPRVLVYQEEFDAVITLGAPPFIEPGLAEAARLNREIVALQAARREADSAKATLQKVEVDLTAVLGAHDLVRASEALDAAASLRDLVSTELRRRPEMSAVYPSESELATAFIPVQIEDCSQLKKGDVIFHADAKQVMYQHGNERNAPETGEELKGDFLTKIKGHVCLRPLGAQGVLALRWRLTTQRLRVLAEAESKLNTPIHKGRAQGLRAAHELLTLPAWTLPPIRLTKAKEGTATP